MKAAWLLLLVLLGAACAGPPPEATPTLPTITQTEDFTPPDWSAAELDTLRSLWIGSLPSLPPDPSNRVADNPDAARLGKQIFFDPRFSGNGQISCATCHQPERAFTDGLPRAQAIGQTERNTPTIIGAAYNDWFFWDGRKDSQWSQALSPLETAVEHGGTRSQYAHILAEDPDYRAAYERLFGPLPDISDRSRFPDAAGPVDDAAAAAAWEGMTPADQDAINRIFANMGKAIAAYERKLLPGPSRFDRYVEAVLTGDTAVAQTALTPDEITGLRIFIGFGLCTDCHNGPLFTNNEFRNIGVPTAAGLPVDPGRSRGLQQLLADPFNCLGPYSDADPAGCAIQQNPPEDPDELAGAFKVPTLRNVAQTAPYMHSGQYRDLQEVFIHYDRAPVAPLGQTAIIPINITVDEAIQLEAFLRSLSSETAVSEEWLRP
ncbi:MAG TPA: cytochrome-c peroxidase [Anaerolineae bacterium]|nr:cytochrome-c peroxidase [Anaerolineae bacterium]